MNILFLILGILLGILGILLGITLMKIYLILTSKTPKDMATHTVFRGVTDFSDLYHYKENRK